MMTLVIEKRLFRTIYSLCRKLSITPKNTLVTECQNNSDSADHNDDIMDSDKNYSSLRSGEVKSLKIGIIGLPNVGKSTLVNSLINRPICATAAKVHVTRTNADAIYTQDNTQLVFIDTPGLVSAHEFKKFQLEESFREDTKAAMARADLVGVVQDVTNKYTRGVIHKKILELLTLTRVGVPSVLIMNKVDKMKKKRELLNLVRALTSEEGWPNFSDVFMVSALTSDGISDLRDYLLASAKPSNWEYTKDMVTDQPIERVVERVVHAKLMDSLPQEIPYRLKTNIEYLDTGDDGSLNCVVIVSTPTDRISKLVLGKNGQRIKTVALDSEQALSGAFRTNVRLKIAVKFTESK